MTEMTEYRDPDRLNLPAFLFALIFAPVVIAMIGFWIYLIPVFAVAMGYAPYLFVGGPVLLLYLLLPYIPIVPSALLFVVNYALFSGDGAIAQMLFDYSPSDIKLRLEFGSLFAPMWGGAFECLYAVTRRFR